jgi:hypothetical protein
MIRFIVDILRGEEEEVSEDTIAIHNSFSIIHQFKAAAQARFIQRWVT